MKVFRTLKAATAAAKGMPILRVGKVGKGGNSAFLVFDHEPDLWGVSQNLIELVDAAGTVTGDISLLALDRLGHADDARAQAADTIPDTCFPSEEIGLGTRRPSMCRVSQNVWRKA